MRVPNQQASKDCKSSIVGSIPTRASILPITKLDESCNGFSLRNRGTIVPDPAVENIPAKRVLRGNRGLVYLFFTHKGERFRIATGKTDSELSYAEEREIVENEVRSFDGKGFFTLEETLKAFQTDPEFGGEDKTRKAHANDARDFFQRIELDLSQDIRCLLYKYDEKTLPEYLEKFDLPHKLRRVTSIFGRRNVKRFKSLGYETSCFQAFVDYVPVSPKIKPFRTDDAEVEHVITTCRRLRYEDPELYKVYLLAFSCGLRANEIYKVKYSDLITFGGKRWLQLPFLTKGQKLKGTDHVEQVGIPEVVFNDLQAFSNGDLDQLIVKTDSGAQRFHKKFIKFLRNECGVSDRNPCHRLRKILGARLATSAGIYHAAKQLRNSVSVAESYYSDLVSHSNELRV
jgi:integrase